MQVAVLLHLQQRLNKQILPTIQHKNLTIIIKKEVDNQTTTIGVYNNQDQDPTTGRGHLIQQVFEAWARSSCYSVAFGVQVSANLFE